MSHQLQEAIRMSHSRHSRASSERLALKPDRKTPWGELERDEKDGGALNQSN